MDYIDRLIRNCEIAKSSHPVREFEYKDSSSLDGIDKAIYVIEQIGGNVESTFIEFSRYKEKKESSCAKLNAPSKIMYVGSSATGIKTRIKQHTGSTIKGKGTYALHLSHWFSGEYKITIKVYDVERDVLQIIEDALSDTLKPAFGKQGGNNK